MDDPRHRTHFFLRTAMHGFDAGSALVRSHRVPDWRDAFAEIARVTRESYFTVIERSEGDGSILREYDTLVRDAGHRWNHPGFHERDLPGLVKPDIVMPVGPFRESIPANSILEELAGRAYSSQWEVPEAIHRAAMQKLRAAWAGKDVDRSYTLEVTFWRAGRLPGITKASAQRA